MRIQDIPEFGNLSDVTVVFMGVNVACPFGAELLAEQGARVIEFENSVSPDTARCTHYAPWGYLADRRNMLAVNGKLGTPEGNELFLNLMKKTDIFMAGTKGGALAKLGLTDEVMWEANPKLVILHLTGYGESGVKEYLNRPLFDGVAQAYGGIMAINEDNGIPLHTQPNTTDYFVAFFAAVAVLAALNGARRTGIGESIDLAQFETAWRCQWDIVPQYFKQGLVRGAVGAYEKDYVCSGPYQCGDGEWVEISVSGHACIAGLLDLLDIHDERMNPLQMGAFSRHVPEQAAVEVELKKYCLQHTATEVDEAMHRYNVPSSLVYTVETIQDDPHAQARGLFVEWEDETVGTMQGVKIVPDMKVRPGIIWKGAPRWGADNHDIYGDLGYTEAQLLELEEKGIISTPDDGGFFNLAPELNVYRKDA